MYVNALEDGLEEGELRVRELTALTMSAWWLSRRSMIRRIFSDRIRISGLHSRRRIVLEVGSLEVIATAAG